MPIPPDIDPATVNEQVTRILASPAFRNSAILSDFLCFIVTETLKGHEQNLKEYVIATEVLKKNPDFDPQLSAIVRIHASRLRKLLDHYYQEEGLSDPIVVSVPKGRYVPDFKINASRKSILIKGLPVIERSLRTKPTIIVLPFTLFHKNDRLEIICSALTEDLSIELTRFSEIGVISNHSAQVAAQNSRFLSEMASSLGADYAITGSCFLEGSGAKIKIGLNSFASNELLWADSFQIEDIEQIEIKGYSEIISKVIAMICGFFGLITREALRETIPEDFNYFFAIYWYNRYHQSFNEQAMREALAAIGKGLEYNSRNALLTALQAELLLNIHLFEIEEDTYLKLGTQAAHRAIELDHNCQLGWQTLWWSDLFNHDKKNFLKNVEKIFVINPYNVIHTGTAGFGYICAGEYETGLKHLSESMFLNPYYPWFYNLTISLYHIQENDLEEALHWARKMNRPLFIWDPMIRASVLGLLNKKNEAKEAAGELLNLIPSFPSNAKKITGKFLLDKNLITTILQGLTMAGIDLQD